MGFRGKSLKKFIRPTALITGASQGLGNYLARSFWASGYNLILVSRQKNLLEKLSSELIGASINANHTNGCTEQEISVYSCDFSCTSDIDIFIKTLYLNHASINVLINNAAIQGPVGKSCDTWEIDSKSYREVVQVNLLAPIQITSSLIQLLANSLKNSNSENSFESGGLSQASIINLSGGGATAPRVNFSAYATSKAGLVRFSETLAEEVKDLGIRVNCIAPGAMNTAMLQEVLDKGVQFAGAAEFATAQKIMSEGGASMERVAELALYLAGPDSTGITGKLISAMWDNWPALSGHTEEIKASDIFTLRRIAGRDRGMPWADL